MCVSLHEDDHQIIPNNKGKKIIFILHPSSSSLSTWFRKINQILFRSLISKASGKVEWMIRKNNDNVAFGLFHRSDWWFFTEKPLRIIAQLGDRWPHRAKNLIEFPILFQSPSASFFFIRKFSEDRLKFNSSAHLVESFPACVSGTLRVSTLLSLCCVFPFGRPRPFVI